MDKKPLIVVSLCAVVLLVLASLSNVVGYQSVQTSQQNLIKERINQRELLFQTVCDIANNKEIQRIILKSQMSRGIFPTSDIPVVTQNQLKQMYLIGLVLSKFISKSRIHSMVQNDPFTNSEMQKEMTVIIEKDSTLKGEITQLQTSECECENDNSFYFKHPVLCSILFIIFIVSLIPITLINKITIFLAGLGLINLAEAFINIFGVPFAIIGGTLWILLVDLCIRVPDRTIVS